MVNCRDTIRFAGWVAAVAGLACTGAAPGEDGSAHYAAAAHTDSTSTPASGSATHRVVIQMRDDMTFDPPVARVTAGGTVVWVDDGAIPHTTTGDPAAARNPDHATLPEGAAAWDSGLLQNGETYERVFSVPGDYTYLCTIHEALGMIGRLEVRAEDDAGGS